MLLPLPLQLQSQSGRTIGDNARKEEVRGWYGFIEQCYSDSDEDDEDGSPAGRARRVVSEGRIDLKILYTISIELDVRNERCSSIQRRDNGSKKCYKTNLRQAG